MSPGDVAVASGLATRTDDGSVTFALPPGMSRPTPELVPAAGAATSAPPVDETTTVGASTERPGPEATSGTAEIVGAADETAASQDLAALTDVLYERIEHRLRSDLLHERERLGCLPDL